MKPIILPAIGNAFLLAAAATLLAACGATATVPPAPASVAKGSAATGPCRDRNPAADAGATQGTPPYTGKDSYANVVAAEGTIFYSLTPGAAPGFAVTERTLRDAGGSWEKYYDLVQVTTDPGTDADGKPRKLREMVRAFHVTEPLCVASGTAQANPQFGSGGGIQYYVSPADAPKLRPGAITPIAQWHPSGTGQ